MSVSQTKLIPLPDGSQMVVTEVRSGGIIRQGMVSRYAHRYSPDTEELASEGSAHANTPSLLATTTNGVVSFAVFGAFLAWAANLLKIKVNSSTNISVGSSSASGFTGTTGTK